MVNLQVRSRPIRRPGQDTHLSNRSAGSPEAPGGQPENFRAIARETWSREHVLHLFNDIQNHLVVILASRDWPRLKQSSYFTHLEPFLDSGGYFDDATFRFAGESSWLELDKTLCAAGRILWLAQPTPADLEASDPVAPQPDPAQGQPSAGQIESPGSGEGVQLEGPPQQEQQVLELGIAEPAVVDGLSACPVAEPADDFPNLELALSEVIETEAGVPNAVLEAPAAVADSPSLENASSSHLCNPNVG